MKIFTNFILILIALFFLNCESPVVFSSPQPVDEPELLSVPQEYRGIYWCEVDSIVLYIEEKIIYKEKKLESKFSVSEIDTSSSLLFKENLLYSEELKEWFPATQENNTIIATITLKDTLFMKQKGQVLKSFKGHLILNEQVEKDLWEVMVFSLKHQDVLSIAMANIPDNLEELEQITPIEKLKTDENKNPVQIKIAPSQAEFDQILSKGLLFNNACYEFKRIFPIAELPL